MKITKSQLKKIIQEELALVKETDNLFGERAYEHSLVSNVSKALGWEIDQAFNFILDLLEDVNAHGEYEGVKKVFSNSIDMGGGFEDDKGDAFSQSKYALREAAPAPGSQAFPRGLAPELDKSPEGQAKLATKQEYDALTTMITRLDGMEGFLLSTTRQKSDEALTQQAAEQLNALHATLSQMRKGL